MAEYSAKNTPNKIEDNRRYYKKQNFMHPSKILHQKFETLKDILIKSFTIPCIED